MLKKILAVIMAIVAVFPVASCNETKKEENEVSQALMEHYQNDDIYYDYKTNHYKFRLPKFWKGKDIVDVTTHREDFYEVNSYDADGTGLLFSILEFEDESYKELENYTYLCYDKRFDLHYVFVTPEEDKFPEEFAEQFNDLKQGVNIAKVTFKAEL